MKLDELMDFGLLNEMLAQKYIKRQNNAGGSLSILSYCDKSVWDNVWNEVTRNCRGLIYDPVTLDIVARPFPKFFNFSQHSPEDFPKGESFRVYTKVDGSLSIFFNDPATGLPTVATRGSFTSEQAQHATALLREKYPSLQLSPDYTFLAEVVYPSNRIVVSYGEMDDLVLLDILEIETGASVLDKFKGLWPGPVVEEHGYATSSTPISELAEIFTKMGHGTDMEGVVIKFEPSGFRVKIKSDEYVRLHRIMTGVNARDVWEVLSEGRDLAELGAGVPNEFHEWIRVTASELQEEFESLTVSLRREYMRHMASITAETSRREIAEKFKEDMFASFYFLLLDGKIEAFEKAAWKQLRPVGTRNTTFKTVNPDAD